MKRTANCLAKLERMNKALRHEEPDRVPISDFFWGSFIRRWRKELNLPDDASPIITNSTGLSRHPTWTRLSVLSKPFVKMKRKW